MSDKIYNFYDGAQNVEHIETQIININMPSASPGKQEDVNDAIVTDLMPIFSNNKEEVQKFISAIQGQSNRAIVNLVKQLIEKGVIAQSMSRKPLCEALMKHNLYSNSLPNWNQLMSRD